MKDPTQYMRIMWCACATLTGCFCSHGNISECRSYKYRTHLHVSVRMHASETPNTTSNIRRWFGQMADPANDLSCTLDLDFIGPSRAVHGSGRVGFWPNPNSTRRRRVEGRSNPKSTGSMMVSVGQVGSVAGIKKGIEIWKKRHRNLKFLPETGNSCQNLENFIGNWKILTKNWIFFEICIFFSTRNYWVWPDLAKSH